jgi:hypothetical protein
MGYGYFIFTFDEEILASTFNVSAITYTKNSDSSKDTELDRFYLEDGAYNDLALQGNTSAPYVYMSSDDYARLIYYNYTFGSSAATSYVYMDAGGFETYNGIKCEAVTTPVQASYLPDTLPPFVETFSYDADKGHLRLVFSEPLHQIGGNGTGTGAIMNLTGIAIQGQNNIQLNKVTVDNYVQLVDYSEEDEIDVLYTDNYGREVVTYIGFNNVNALKMGGIIGRTVATTWLSLYSSTVTSDVAGNKLALANMDQFDALEVTTYVADTSSPTLLWWTYDVYWGKAVLRFTEVIDVLTFNYSACYFASNNTVTNTTIIFRIDGDDDLTSRQSTDNYDLILEFSEQKLGELLDISSLLSNETNSFLVLETGAPWDNSVAQNVYDGTTTSVSDARRVQTFYPDLVRPMVVSAVLDMNNRTLLLGFDKFVTGASLNSSYLWLQTSRSAGTNTKTYYFEESGAPLLDSSVPDSKFVTLSLSDDAFNELKLYDTLSRVMSSTFIGFSDEFIHDKAVAKNKIVERLSSDAFALTGYVADTSPPSLDSFYFNMNAGEVVLTFSEPMSDANFDFTSITLYSDNDADAATTYSYSLTNSTTLYQNVLQESASVADRYINEVVVSLSTTELNELKDLAPLCQSYATCYISFESSLGTDVTTYSEEVEAYVSNAVQAVDMEQSTSDYIPDTTGPKIQSFSLDMGNAQILMIFDEPIYRGYFESNAITLYKDFSNMGTNVTLSTSTYVENYLSSTYLEITLSKNDFVAMKSQGIGDNATNSAYMSTESFMVEDVAGNSLNGSTASGFSGSYYFDGYTATVVTGYTNNNPSQPIYATQTFPAFSLEADQVVTAAVAVSADATPPTLLAIYSHPTTRNMTLYFDDLIELSTIDTTYMYLYSVTNDASQHLIESEIQTTADSGDILLYFLDSLETDLIAKGIGQTQAETAFYTTQTDTFLDFPEGNVGAIIDVSSRVIEGLQLLYWRLDSSLRIIRIACSHLPDLTTIDPTKFSVYSSLNLEEVALTASEAFTVENDDTIVIQVDVVTYASITSAMSIADKATIFLKVDDTAVVDVNGKSLGASDYTLTCKQIVIDTNPPQLVQYEVDLNHGILTIYFDKPITIATVQLSSLYLYALNDDSANYVSLSSATLSTTANGVTAVEIDFGDGDYPTLRDQIHLSGDIGAAVASTYLRIDKGFVADTNEPMNYMSAIPLVNATQPATLTQDTTKPVLTSWTIDLDAMVLTATYDEAVDASASLASYYLLLEDKGDTTSAQLYLKTSTTQSSAGGPTVTIDINNIDMNAIKIKSPDLCMTQSKCLLSVKANAITDISHNSNGYGGQLFAYATTSTVYQADVTAPTIQMFNYSASTGELWLEMDEIVVCSTVDLSQLVFQYAAFLGTSSQYVQVAQTALDCTYATGALSKSLYAELDIFDFTAIKAKSDLFKSADTSFLGGGTGAFTDVFGNEFVAIASGNGIQTSAYEPDTERPVLNSYTISASKILYLYFNEPVNTATFDVSKIQFSNTPAPHTHAYNLTDQNGYSALYTSDTYKEILQITLGADYTFIVTDSTIFSQQETTYLAMDSSVISDTGGNAVVSIIPEDAVPLGPSINSWTLNLDTGLLTLEFNEKVFEHFDVAGIEFQHGVTRANLAAGQEHVVITTTTNVTSMDGTAHQEFSVVLNDYDLNNLKYEGIGFTLGTTYLVAPFGLTNSEVASTLVPNLKTTAHLDYRALKVSVLYADTTVPDITSFAVDMNIGTVLLRFTEPIDISSLDITGLTLLSTSEGTTVALTGYDSATVENVTNLVIDLTSLEFNEAKLAHSAGELDALLVSANAIADVSGNGYPGNTELNVIPAVNNTDDATPPELINADLNLDAGELELTFDEVINDARMLPRYVTIMSQADPDDVSTVKVQLTNYSIISMDESGLVLIDLKSYGVDFTSLSTQSSLATSTADTFILYQYIEDVFGNFVATATVRQADSLIPDTTEITVSSFTWDDQSSLNNNRYDVSIFYDKAATLADFKCSEYGVAVSSDSATVVTFADDDCTLVTSASSSREMAFQVSGTTAASINDLGVDVGVLVVDKNDDGNGITDAYGNNLATTTYKIEAGIHITRWFLDLDIGEITFLFSPAIDTTCVFNVTSLGLYSVTTGEEMWLTSTNGSLSKVFDTSSAIDDSSATYTIDADDLNSMKSLDIEDGVYLMVRDKLMISSVTPSDFIVNIAETAAFEPFSFQGDTVKPVLMSSSFDLGAAKLYLRYSEPIRASSVVQSNFRVQSVGHAITNSLVLGSGSASVITDADRYVTISLSSADQATLMLSTGLADNITTTYISYSSNSLKDYAGNSAKAKTTSAAVQVDFFTADSTNPSLQTYDLNMDTGIITFRFSEPVVVSTMDITAVTLMARSFSADGGTHQLTGGTILDSDSSVVRVQLTDEDIFEIKHTQGLCRVEASTFVIITAGFCTDTSSNAVNVIVDGGGRPVTTFTADSTAPYVTNIEFDVENHRVVLNMSELIELSSVDLTALTIQDGQYERSNYHTVGSSSTIYNPNNELYMTKVMVDFDDADLNVMKYYFPLLSTQNNSCVSLYNTFVDDVYGNSITAISASDAKRPSLFFPDVSPPVVTEYSLDMSTATIELTFDESIKFDAVNLSQINIQEFDRSMYGAIANMNQTSVVSGSGVNSVKLSIIIDSDTAAQMKYEGIATSLETSYISFSDAFASDQMSTYAEPKWDGTIYLYEPFLPNEYSADIAGPTLEKWQIDRMNKVVILHFDEPCNLVNSSWVYISTTTSLTTSGVKWATLGSITESHHVESFSRKHYFTLYEESCSALNRTSMCFQDDIYEVFDDLSFYLLMQASAFTDYSLNININSALMTTASAAPESSPICTACEDGYYISEVCTETEDRVCTACSVCDTGYYTAEACSTYADTNCKECQSCAYGKYISVACGASNDNSCTDCSSCGIMEYESTKCLLGLNTACSSCESCSLEPADELVCLSKGQYESWYNGNCCFDNDGVQVACKDLDKANMKITARSGRHHWVFEDESVDSNIYGLGSTY